MRVRLRRRRLHYIKSPLAMLARVQPIAPVLLGITFVQLALGALAPFVGLLLAQRGVPTPTIGLVTSAYYIGFLGGSLSCAAIVDRVGHIRAFTVFAAIGADCVLLHAVTTDPLIWGALRAATGYAMSGAFLITESWLNDKVGASSRGRVFAAYLFVSWSASAIGPLALNLHNAANFLFILIAICFATALIPMALTQVSNPEIAGRTHFGVRRLFAVSPLGAVACFAAGLVNSAFYGLIPVYGETVGLGAGPISVLLTTALVGGLLAQYPIGMVSDRYGRRPTMLAVLIVGLVFAIGMFALAGRVFPALLAFTFVYAAMTAPLYGLGAGQTNDYVSPKEFVGASGGLLFAWALGASAGPIVAAAAMDVLGPGGLFLYLVAVLAVIALFTIFRMLRRTGLPLALQTGFVPAPQTPPGIAEFDPRSAAAARAGDKPA
jgi:MFS family permease